MPVNPPTQDIGLIASLIANRQPIMGQVADQLSLLAQKYGLPGGGASMAGVGQAVQPGRFPGQLQLQDYMQRQQFAQQQALETQKAAAAEEIWAARGVTQEKIEALKEKHSTELEGLKKTHSEALEGLKHRHAQELAGAREEAAKYKSRVDLMGKIDLRKLTQKQLQDLADKGIIPEGMVPKPVSETSLQNKRVSALRGALQADQYIVKNVSAKNFAFLSKGRSIDEVNADIKKIKKELQELGASPEAGQNIPLGEGASWRKY